MGYTSQAKEVSRRFVIGYIGTNCYWTNWPVFENPTNDALLSMTDEQLKQLAYSSIKKDANGLETLDGVRQEKYQRPTGKEAENQGGTSGETYYAPCRAICILQFRQSRDSYNARMAAGEIEP
jgi:hypothetical protein